MPADDKSISPVVEYRVKFKNLRLAVQDSSGNAKAESWRCKIALDPGTDSTPYTLSVSRKAFNDGFLHSGELARLAGISTDTLRYYERKGLFPRPHRAANGYRQYPPETLDRIRLVRRALAVGFSVDELSRLLAERDKGKAPCRQVRALLQEKLTGLERQLADLEALRGELQGILSDWDERLGQTETGKQARLLDALAADSKTEGRRTPATSRLNGAKSKRSVR